MMPLPWLTRCTGTCRIAASLMTACIAAGPSHEGISIRYCPPSSNRLLDNGKSCASRDGSFCLVRMDSPVGIILRRELNSQTAVHGQGRASNGGGFVRRDERDQVGHF